MEDSHEGRKPNRLINESSPYLLQHAHNPVDWHPWGPRALQEASESDRPILLSVGYSACHWCHVMERESFEDPEIAELMNRLFVNVKVDREERPDVDSLYMNYVQMTTGSGGWPLTVFLTPDRVPFYGGTYFPPEDRFGRPGFSRVLQNVADAYRSRRDELNQMRPAIIERLSQASRFETPQTEIRRQLMDEAATHLSRQFDPRHGGFGSAPKFPSSMVLAFLLRYQHRSGSKSSLEMVAQTLDAMARGGMYDQLGGGFHRYSVDDRWLVPHFEKMLYDNALLSRLYLEAYQVTGNQSFRRVAEGILEYVQREMTGPSGGFYSAEDADSEGEEGKFYVWSLEEIQDALPADVAPLFCEFYGVSATGNFEGHNILHVPAPTDQFVQRHGMEESELDRMLAVARARLLELRAERIRPGLDDKVLASWNGWMLHAFAVGAWTLGRQDFLETAQRNARFLDEQMLREGRVFRAWKEGEARLNGYLEDYSAVAEGFLALYQVTGTDRWLKLARQLTEVVIERFWDSKQGDFYFTADDHEELLVRQKEHLDNATPSGNSNTCANLLRLAVLTGEKQYRELGQRMLERLGLASAQHPLAFGNWLQCLDFFIGPVAELAVLGEEAERRSLLEPLRRRFLPNRVLVQASQARADLPLLEGKPQPPSGAVAYVCRDNTCGPPAKSPEELAAQLEGLV